MAIPISDPLGKVRKTYTFTLAKSSKDRLTELAELRFAGNSSAALEWSIGVLSAVLTDPVARGQASPAEALEAYVKAHAGK